MTSQPPLGDHRCPPRRQLRDFLAGSLSEAEIVAVADHLDRCADCARTFTALDPATTASEADSRPAAQDSTAGGAAGDLGRILSRAGLVAGEIAGDDDRSLAGDDLSTSRIGDYDLYGRIGTGGMGIVYRARRRRDGAEVAVKILGRVDADAVALQRFRLEASTAQSFSHPNIVRVQEINEANGRWYIVMDLVVGQSLAELTRESPIDSRSAAGFVQQVASAAAHAHQRGVLHRDIKPSNIMVRGDGQALLTDFGVAKLLDAETQLTRDGEPIGTPAFMSPEQTRGDRDLTPASDVYSLGVVLYHLAIGRSPFASRSKMETLHRIQHEHPVSLRKINPSIPADYETICMQCLRKEPSRRYASALALADDLARFGNGRPIHARPESSLAIVWRRIRQYPKTSATVGTLLAVIAACQIVIVGLYLEAKIQVKRAAETLTLATETLDEHLAATMADKEFMSPAHLMLRKKVLSELVRRNEAFYTQNADHPLVRERMSAAYYQWARVNHSLGTREETLAAFDRARDIAEQLMREFPDEPRHRHHWANSVVAIGLLRWQANRDPDALELIESGRKVLAELARADPRHPKYLTHYSGATQNLTAVLLDDHRAVEARELLSQTIADWKRLRPDEVLSPSVLNLQQNLAISLSESGDTKAACEIWDELVAARAAHSELHPDDVKARHGYVIARINRAALRLENPPDLDGAIEDYSTALPLARENVERSADDLDLWEALGICQYGLADVQSRAGRHNLAVPMAELAVKCFREIVERSPDHLAFRGNLSKASGLLANAYLETDRPIEAAEQFVALGQQIGAAPNELFQIACDLAQCAAKIDARADVSEDDRLAREKIVLQTVATLSAALDAGFADVEKIAQSKELDAVRESTSWREQIAPRLAKID